MTDVTVYDASGKKTGSRRVDDALLEGGVRLPLLQQAALAYQANAKEHTASTKTRGEVAGSGKKPWAQKHTGRARAGCRRSPLWRGGGKVFGPRPKEVTTLMPRRMKRAALRGTIAGKVASAEIYLLDGLKLDKPRTRTVHGFLEGVGILGATILILTDSATMLKSARNIPRVTIKTVKGVNAHDLLNSRFIVMTKEDFDTLLARANN
ncbi:MAG: 50S ribosomal protein L4 [Planctomycetota bacterium]